MSPNRRDIAKSTLASKERPAWRLLMATGLYTGHRLGDCCRLAWEGVNLDRQVIQVFPEKTKKHLKGRPVTIPIHPQLLAKLEMAGNGASASGGTGSVPSASGGSHSCATANGDMGESATRDHEKSGCETYSVGRAEARPSRRRVEGSSSSPIPHASSLSPHSPTGFVNPVISNHYTTRKWQLDEGLRRIFKAANITMSVRLEGRCRKTVIASFHSLRHTFVSLSANAGVHLPVVQSIVRHTSTAMTRHYYHENLDALRAAVASIPVIGNRRDEGWGMRDEKDAMREGRSLLRPNTMPNTPSSSHDTRVSPRPLSLASRLKRLSQLLAKGLITAEEYDEESRRVRDAIIAWIAQPVKDGKLKGCFDHMSEKRHRFFQWVEHPEVEAENNLAERRLRPLVVARKVCFGSQSEKGLKTRETLMSVIDTLKLRCDDPVRKLSGVFDALARDRDADVSALLWGAAQP